MEMTFFFVFKGTFHPADPQSVASALHMVGLKLKPKNFFADLTDFEKDVLKYFGQFSKTKALKVDVERPNLPPAHLLAKYPAVSRLVDVVASKEVIAASATKKVIAKWEKFFKDSAKIPRGERK